MEHKVVFPIIISIIILGALGFSQTAQATTFSTPLQVTNSVADGVNPGAPVISVSGNTVFIAWTSHDLVTSTNNIKYKISTDGGNTFPFSGLAVSGRTLPVGSLNIETSGGNFYVSWTEIDFTTITSDAFFSVSSSTSGPFTAPTNIFSAAKRIFDFDMKAVGNNVYVLLEDENTRDIFFIRSINGGTSFLPTVNLTNTGTSANESEQFLHVVGTDVFVSYATFSPTKSIKILSSHDSGATFSQATLTSSPNFSQIPVVASSGNFVYVAWREQLSSPCLDGCEIFFSRSTDGGTNWSTPENLSMTPAPDGSANAAIAAAGNNVYVAWQEVPSISKVVIRSSSDNGASFTPLPATQLSTDASGVSQSVKLAAEGNTVHAVWQEPVPGGFIEIIYTKSDDSGQTFDPNINLSNTPGISQQARMELGSVNVVWVERLSPFNEIFYSVGTVPPPTITWDGGGPTDNWSDPLNWSTDTLPTGSDNIIIDDNDTMFSQVHLDIDFTLTTGSLTIDRGDALFIDGTVLTNLSSSTVTNSGFIELGGLITNSGTFLNPGTLFGSESLGSRITNDGMFILSGGLGAAFGPVIINTGTFVVDGGGGDLIEFSNIGTLEIIDGSLGCGFSPTCRFENGFTAIMNIGPAGRFNAGEGHWTNAGEINNEGSFVGGLDKISANGGIINNKPTGRITITDRFVNSGTVNNDGLISVIFNENPSYDNRGTTNNFGTFSLTCNASFIGNPILVNPITLQCRPNFDDFGVGGTTFGTVITGGDQILTILEEPAPDGIRIVTDAAGGPTPAQISFCGGVAEAFFPAASEVRGTCGSVTIEVIRGPVEFVFTGEDGTTVTITLNEDDNVTYDESQSGQITNNGLEEIFISINGGEPFSVIGGETVIIGEISHKEVICHKGKNTISISSNAVDAHIAHGDTLGSCP